MTAIVAIKLTSPITQAAAPFVFGQVFKKGDVPAGQYAHLDLTNFSVVPLCYWNDGSLKMAALIGRVALTAATPKQVNVVLRPSPVPVGTPLTAASIAAAAPAASITFGATGTVSLASLLGSPIRTFISCREMVSCQYAARPGADPSLLGGFHVCLFADGTMSVRVIGQNSKFTVSTARKDYIPTITIGGTTVFNNGGAVYLHSPDAGYDQTGWIGVDPQITPQHDPGYLIRTKLFPNYERLSTASGIISSLNAISNYVPGARLGYSAAMGATGFQPQIGLLNQWDGHYFITQAHPSAWNAVIANARAIKSYAMSQVDPTTFSPIRLADYPTSNVPGGGTYNFSSVAQDGSALTYERAHHPSAAYLAWALTADPYFLEICHYNAKCNYLGESSSSGSGANRLFLGQVRSRAWAMRSIAQAAALTPDNMLSELGDVKTWLANISSNRYNYYVTAQAGGSAYGFEDQYLNYLDLATAPNGANCTGIALWQQDFYASSMGMAYDLEPCDSSGMASIGNYRDYLYRGLPWRFGTQGVATEFNSGYAARYTLNVRKSTAAGTAGGPTAAQMVPTNPGQIFSDSFETAPGTPFTNPNTNVLTGTSASTPSDPTGYWGNMIAALSYAVDHAATGAAASWSRFTGTTNYSDVQGADYAAASNFGLAPRSVAQQAVLFTPVDTGSVTPTPGPSFVWDTVSLVNGGFLWDTYRGLGIPVADIPVGFPQMSLLENDINVPTTDPAGTEYRWEALTGPGGGNFIINPNSSFIFSGPDGSYGGLKRVWKNGGYDDGVYGFVVGTPSTVTSVSVSPSTATGSQTFTATVAGTGTPSQAVTWAASAGTINSSGAFVAPAATGSVQTVTVTATSVQDATKSGSATVTIAAASSTVTGVTVAPSTATVTGGTNRQFTATVLGTFSPSQAVTWGTTAGSISVGGLLTAPAATGSIQTLTVTATSVQDPSKSSTSTVTIPVALASRFARPNADIAAGTWLPSSGSSLYQTIDETVADSNDYIVATSSGTCTIALNPVADPATSVNQVARYQAWSPTGNGLTVRLMQGATVIASWTHSSLPTIPTIFAQPLTGPQCDSITDYTTLRFEFVAG